MKNTICLLLLLTTSTFAQNICKREWRSEHIKRNCSLTYKEKGETRVLEAGIFEKKCGANEEDSPLNDCMIVRTCGYGEDNITSAPLHNIPRHLKSLCLTSKPRKALYIDSQTYVEFSCVGNKVIMTFVAEGKRKTCPLPFKMP